MKDVKDSKYTHEVWILKKIKVKFIGIIKTSNYDWKKQYFTEKGITTFYHYPYKWIEKF